MAKKVRETFDKYDDVDSVVVDNTSVALLRMKKDKTPNKEVIEELLAKHAPRGVKLRPPRAAASRPSCSSAACPRAVPWPS